MPKNENTVYYGNEARETVLKGIDTAANLVAFTLGPKGKSVIVENQHHLPALTSEGYRLIHDLQLATPQDQYGVEFIKDVVHSMHERCGDGTTTAALLFRAIIAEACKQVASGVQPIRLRKGLEKGCAEVLERLKKMSSKVEGNNFIEQVANSAASGDLEVGSLIAQAFEQVGPDGVICIEKGESTESYLEMRNGIKLDEGYLSPYYITDETHMIAELEKPAVLLVDEPLTSPHQFLQILEHYATRGKQLFIIAHDITKDAQATLIMNKMRGILKVAAIRPPFSEGNRTEILHQIAEMTDSTVVGGESGIALQSLNEGHLGQAEQVRIGKDHTILIAESNEQGVQEQHKAAVIKVGAMSEEEFHSRKHLFEVSLRSTQSALKEGVVPGGGLALFHCSQKPLGKDLAGEELIGAKIIEEACKVPLIQLIRNTGHEASIIIEEIKIKGGNHGFHVMNEKVEDLEKVKIMDSFEVVSQSLRIAAESAGLVLMTEVVSL